MTKIKHQDRILEAIDQLRRRKARPDLNRICGYLFRHYTVTCKETQTALEKLVEAEIVIKVDYKGCTSYRNAAKWSMLSYHKSKQEHDFVATLVCRTVAELILVEPNYLDNGVPYEVLGKHVSRKDKRFTKQYFNYVIEHELESGSLVKLQNGNYFVGDPSLGSFCDESESPELNSPAGPNDSFSCNASESDEPLPSPLAIPKKPSDESKKKNPNMPNSDERETPTDAKQKAAATTDVKSKPSTPVEAKPKVSIPVEVKQKPTPPAEVKRKQSPPVVVEEKESIPSLEEIDFSQDIEMIEEPDICDKPQPSTKEDSRNLSDSKVGSDIEENNTPDIRAKSPPAVKRKNEEVSDLGVNGRRKRSKKIVFDPSDNNLPKAKRGGKKGKPVATTKASPPSSKNNSPAKQVRKNSCDSTDQAKKVEQNTSSMNTSKTTSSVNTSKNTSSMNTSKNTSSIFQPVCGICDCSEKRVKGALDTFISCTDCITKVHLKCFKNTKASGSMFKVNLSNWQCSNCKTCSFCEDSAEVDKLITCYACDEAFHALCHDTISNNKTKVPKFGELWYCSSCFQTSRIEMEEEKPKTNSVKSTAVKPEPVSTSQSLSCSRGDTDSEFDQKDSVPLEPCFNDPFEGYPVDETVPDASNWSSEDVFKYFIKYFQPSIAEIFKKQEIDGLSLLLMKRYDILSGFNLKLGPALKVYGHVRRLQLRRTVPQLLWL